MFLTSIFINNKDVNTMKNLTKLSMIFSLFSVVAHAEPTISQPALNATTSSMSSLKTNPGNEFGVTLSNYTYEEQVDGRDFMKIKSKKIGLNYTGTLLLRDASFLRADLNYATGKGDYSSSGTGTVTVQSDWYYDVRGLIGKDFNVASFIVAPYIGLGYRYLFDDARGTTSTGATGYRRESHYVYIPMGFIHKMHLTDSARLETAIEYDRFIVGRQVSHLSDSTSGQQYYSEDAHNNQNGGYGFRISSMYKTDTWAFGPYLTYWDIDRSNIIEIRGSAGRYFVNEPENQTTEIGIKVSYQF
jgi:hypothetical protein